MPATVYDEEYKDGQLIRRVERQISDLQIRRDGAAPRLRTVVATLDAWAVDAKADAATLADTSQTLTNAQLRGLLAKQFNRLGSFYDRFGDLLLALGVDQ